jgi:hypothetical protein
MDENACATRCDTKRAGSAEIDNLSAIFDEIALEQGWNPGDDLLRYSHRSIYFPTNCAGSLAGGLQLVLPDETGTWPFHAVWPEIDLGCRSDVAHVAVWAVLAAFRGNATLHLLPLVDMWRYAVRSGITELRMEASPAKCAAYRRMGLPIEIDGPLRCHWGEPVLPCAISVEAVEKSFNVMAERSERYRFLVERGYRRDS